MHSHSHGHSHSIHEQLTGPAAEMMRRATRYSLMAGGFLVFIKALAWSLTGSLSLLSSLADSALDVMASTVNFLAIRYALMPADDNHRFGHGKAEELAALAQSTFICGSGAFLIIEAVRRFFSPEPTQHNLIGIGVMGVSIVVTLALVLYQRRVVRATGSSAVAADSMHYVSDLLSNVAVIVALCLAQYAGVTGADPFFALAIAGYLIYGAARMGYTAFHNLMDHEFSPEERAQIEAAVTADPEVGGIHDLRTRKSGLYRFIQFHLDLPPDMTLRQAHIISDRVETAVLNLFPNAEILIHQDPLEHTAAHPSPNHSSHHHGHEHGHDHEH